MIIRLENSQRWSHNNSINITERIEDKFLSLSKKISETSLRDVSGGEIISLSFWEVPEEAVVIREVESYFETSFNLYKEKRKERIPAKKLVSEIFNFPTEFTFLVNQENKFVSINEIKIGDIITIYIGTDKTRKRDKYGEIKIEKEEDMQYIRDLFDKEKLPINPI